MKQILVLAFTCTLGITHGQTAFLQQVVGNTGAVATVGNYEFSYTVGEVAVHTIGNVNGLHMTEGFHQPEHLLNDALNEQAGNNLQLALYPNPAADELWIGYQLATGGMVSLTIYTIDGKFVSQLATENYAAGKCINHYAVNNLSCGQYVLSLQTTANNQTSTISKTFIIAK